MSKRLRSNADRSNRSNQSNSRKLALYVGAGVDTLPYLRHSELDFVASDSLPCNAHGHQCLKDCNHSNESRCKCCAPFLDRLKGLMVLEGYSLTSSSDDIDPKTRSGRFVFKKNNQTVTYYYNTPYLPSVAVWDQYKDTFSVLILSGFFPQRSIAKVLKKDCTIIGARSSLFEDHSTDRYWSKDNRANIVSHMFKQDRYSLRRCEPDTSNYSCLLEDFDTGKKIKLSNIVEIEGAKQSM